MCRSETSTETGCFANLFVEQDLYPCQRALDRYHSTYGALLASGCSLFKIGYPASEEFNLLEPPLRRVHLRTNPSLAPPSWRLRILRARKASAT